MCFLFRIFFFFMKFLCCFFSIFKEEENQIDEYLRREFDNILQFEKILILDFIKHDIYLNFDTRQTPSSLYEYYQQNNQNRSNIEFRFLNFYYSNALIEQNLETYLTMFETYEFLMKHLRADCNHNEADQTANKTTTTTTATATPAYCSLPMKKNENTMQIGIHI